jgi:hypothetical protein
MMLKSSHIKEAIETLNTEVLLCVFVFVVTSIKLTRIHHLADSLEFSLEICFIFRQFVLFSILFSKNKNSSCLLVT